MKRLNKFIIFIALTAMFSVVVNAQSYMPAYLWANEGAFSLHPKGFNKANLADVSSTFQIAENDDYFIKAGDFAESTLYIAGIDYTTSEEKLFSVNTQTGELILIGVIELIFNIPPYGDIDGHISGIAYDETAQIMYISTQCRLVSPIDTTIAKLFTINLTNANVTEIGLIFDPDSQSAEYRLNAGIACDNEGNLYGASYEEDKLYSINKSTGEATEIGDLGIDFEFTEANDLAYDRSHGVLYGSLYRDDDPQPYNSDIFTINTITGEATYIGQSDSEMGAFAIPTVYSATFTVTDQNTNPINEATVNINNNTTKETWTIQTGTDGTAIFQNFENGIYNYEIIKTGYDTHTNTFNINNNNELINVTLTENVAINTLSENIITIFPNPSNGIFTIDLLTSPKGLSNVKITDLTGKSIHNSQYSILNSQFSIKEKGIYFITIKTETNIYTKKIIIQ